MHANPLLERPARALPARIGVVGAGTIGPDIAYYLKTALPASAVVLHDIRAAAATGSSKPPPRTWRSSAASSPTSSRTWRATP